MARGRPSGLLREPGARRGGRTARRTGLHPAGGPIALYPAPSRRAKTTMNPQATLPTPERKDHDQIFKGLFEAFLPEYMWLFHAEEAAHLDFSRIHFARQDLFSDLPHGDRRTLDVVSEVGPDTPEGRVVVLHGEIEYDRRAAVLEEMFEAYGWLRKRFRREVLPLLLYLTTGAEGRTEEVYVELALGRQVVEFRILCVALRGMDGLQYRNEANPLGPALASLMRHPGESRVSHKAHCLRGGRRPRSATPGECCWNT